MPWSIDRLLKETEVDRLRYEPGEGWSYSNIGYLLVRQIIERTTDQELGDALQQLVFDPLDLNSVRLKSCALPELDEPRKSEVST